MSPAEIWMRFYQAAVSGSTLIPGKPRDYAKYADQMMVQFALRFDGQVSADGTIYYVMTDHMKQILAEGK
jgi:hypothetical protein